METAELIDNSLYLLGNEAGFTVTTVPGYIYLSSPPTLLDIPAQLLINTG